MDIAGIETLLTDEERAVRDRVRSWVEDESVVGVMDGHWDAATFPYELLPGLGALGIAGGIVDRDTAARGGTTWPTASASRRSHGHPAASRPRSTSRAASPWPPSGCTEATSRRGGGCRRWLASRRSAPSPPPSRRRAPDLGSLQTSARSVAGGWVLDGEKRWIGHGTVCDVAVVWARTEDGRINGFLVEKGSPGWSAEVIAGKGSQRAVWQAHIVMAGCRVPGRAGCPASGGWATC